MKGVGGIGGLLLLKVLGIIGFLIVVGALLIPTIGGGPTATLYGTGAVVGGQSTGITLASIPTYFSNIRVGQDLVNKATSNSGQLTATPKCSAGQKLDPKTRVCV